MLTFEQSPFLGAANIITKLQVCHNRAHDSASRKKLG